MKRAERQFLPVKRLFCAVCISKRSLTAVIAEISAASKGLFASFGASDDAFLDVVFGNFNPQGKLPIELPSSMEAVVSQKEDLPIDSKDPLYKFGLGLH